MAVKTERKTAPMLRGAENDLVDERRVLPRETVAPARLIQMASNRILLATVVIRQRKTEDHAGAATMARNLAVADRVVGRKEKEEDSEKAVDQKAAEVMMMHPRRVEASEASQPSKF